jgi:hypothetical protein
VHSRLWTAPSSPFEYAWVPLQDQSCRGMHSYGVAYMNPPSVCGVSCSVYRSLMELLDVPFKEVERASPVFERGEK